MDILNIENCTISYQGQKAAVDDVSLSIGEKEIVSIVGESGSGKTTLIRAILGILPPGGKVTDGKILFQGKNILELDERSLQKIRGTEIAMIFQDVGASLDPIRIVDSQYRESILVHRKMPKEECRGLEKKMLTKMHLTDPERVLGSYPFELSGGMKQRTLIAAAMLDEPEILFLDEPTVGLDPKQITEIRALIKELGKTHTIILSSHILSEVSQICQKVIIINKGKIIAVDTPENLENKVASKNDIYVTVEDLDNRIEEVAKDIKEITKIELVKENKDKTKQYLIESEKDVDLRKILFKELAKENITIFEMKKADTTLEDAFMKLIEGGN